MDENDKSNSPDGWTDPGTDGQLNGRLKSKSSNGWTDGELTERLENNSPNGWKDVE